LKVLRLILGDQLNSNHSWFKDSDHDYLYVMMEIKDETNYVKHHIQKILAIFAAMRHFNHELQIKNFNTLYLKISDERNKQTFIKNLVWIVEKNNVHKIEYQEPDEYRLDALFQSFINHFNIPVQSCSSEHFYANRESVKEFFTDKKQWRMEYFYRHMRKKHNVLMEPDSTPHGGKWNFDADN